MIFFDIDGTLVDHEKASAAASLVFYDQFAALLGGAREEFPLVWEATLTRHFKRFCRGEISLIAQRQDRVREVFNDPALSDEEVDRRYEAFAQVYESSCCLFDDVLPCLTHLGHSRLGVISNGGTRQQRKKLRQNGLLGKFSVVMISEEIGVGKPDQRIFLEACKKANVKPEACVYVGDSLETDILPSRSLGINGIWLNRKRLPLSSMRVPEIASLCELEKIVSLHSEACR